MLNIVLHQPEIPANTGNIGRTCVATGTVLHLIEPLGFSLSEKQLKRAGMDYWNLLDVRRYINFADFLEKNPTLVSGEPDAPKLWMATTKAHRTAPSPAPSPTALNQASSFTSASVSSAALSSLICFASARTSPAFS